ncbi:hypothetical protein Tco_0736041 [Tanacetum coccineum]
MDFQDELNRLKEMLNLRNSNQDPPVDFYDLKGSDEGDNEINSLTMEPSDTFLMGDEVTSVYDDLECDMPITIPLPTSDVREEDFDINSPLGEQVVDFLMENVDVAGLPRHLVKHLFNHLIKKLSLTKGMSDEPLGDDLISISYDVTFSNPLFDFNDDFTLCNDNSLFDEEFEDISSLDPPDSTLVIDESSVLVTPLPDPKQICLREVERFDHFFSLTQSGGTTRVIETYSLCFHHMPSPRPTAYSPKEVQRIENEAKMVRGSDGGSRAMIGVRDYDSLSTAVRVTKDHNEINSLTKEPLDTFLMGNEVISTIPKRENDDFIKSSVDDLVPIPRESKMTSVSPAYTLSLPFLATMEPTDTLLMRDEVISTTPKRENDEFIKSSVDDLVSILRESKVTSESNSECDMPTPFPTTDVRKEDFYINSPLGE